MKIRIIGVGKLKEKYLKEGTEEYIKRISAYADVEVIEVEDEPIPKHPSLAQEVMVKAKEGRRVLDQVKQSDFMILLDVAGTELDSVDLSKYIEKQMIDGHSTIDFVLGGSLGNSEDVLQRADYRLSMSRMTMPHQLARLVLLEQIYRSFKIMKGETYHK
jgi:23S rRNA (pseudouridine1915-N3)-methyltransferase